MCSTSAQNIYISILFRLLLARRFPKQRVSDMHSSVIHYDGTRTLQPCTWVTELRRKVLLTSLELHERLINHVRSLGDFHAGLLLSATIPTPTLFLVRNNGFAISTPAVEQYGLADGIVSRGPGYGIPSIRVDGNDVLAVLGATRKARQICLETGRGVLVEAMTYRVGHHSTSDDSFAYRPRTEVEARKKLDDPIGRFRLFLDAKKWWNDQEEEELKTRLRKDVMKAFKEAETVKKHPVGSMFEDVYGGEMPWTLV
jgi:2-oxoisovalerate dehydrogenase E1 component alpha subunit